uniref:Transporter n=1 Tax=Macrostomum lignano TaxID=282301 RepID=A0A1I8I895_9PLAT
MAEKDRNDGDKPRNASNSADTADEKLLKNSRGSAEEATDESDGPATPVHPGYVAGAIYQSDEKVYNPEETQPFAVANQELGPVAAAAAAAAMATSNSNAADPQSNVETGDLPVDAAQQGRAAWGGKVEFFLTAIGYAVGLGNVWRFPYLCYKNGGGAFLLPYCLMLALVGLPCFFLELSFGQFASLGPLTIWRCLFYLVHSFQARLPWESCDESWRSGLCREYRSPGESENATEAISYGGAYWNFTGELECSFNSTNVSTKCRAPSEEFYERYVLRLTSSIEDYGDFNWRLAIALFIAWIVVTLVLIKGIQSLGKVSYFTAIFPYLMLTAMLIRGATLPGALQGVLFYVKPKWGRLLDYKVWMEAATQIFFSLSCCNGGLIAMSSYNKFRNNCQRDAVIVALINCATSVFAGFVIFCNLGFMAHKKNVRVEDVAKGGPGLAFVVYPEALTHMPLSPLWAVLFFIMMATLGFGSQVKLTLTQQLSIGVNPAMKKRPYVLIPNFIPVNSTNVSTKCRAPSEEFYERYVLRLTSSIEDYGDFNWRLAIALFIAWIVVTLVLIKGIQSLGKVSYFTAIFPYLMLTAMLIRGATLPGALQGVLFYVKPKWGRLLDYKVWMEAATQIFFSLSCCNGGLIAMSSYNKFRNNCQRDAVIVALINCATSVFAGFVIFCNLGFMAHKKNVRVEDVAKGGPGLAFVVYPEALTHMPLSPLWAVLFFIMMATLGFGSQFSITETVLCAFQDELRAMGVMGASKKHAVIYRVIVCSFLFLLGLTMCFGGGMYLLNLVDNAVSTFPLLVCCIVELVVLMYIYPYKQLAEDIRLMVGGKPNIYWRATWVVITPLVMVILIILMAVFNEPITYGTYKYSPPFQLLCVLIGLFIIAWIPALAIYRYCREGGWILLREFLKPVEDWGPAKPKHRSQFLDKLAQESTEGPAAFFQSKLSIAAEMQRAASK